MRVLYFHQHFKTPYEGGSIRSYLLAKALLDKGHEVIMITAHNAPREEKNVDGIQVIYLHVPYDNTYKFWRRVWAFLAYTVRSCILSTRIKSIDCCYIMTTPLTTGLIGAFNRLFLKRNYFFEVGDLWPLVPIEMEFIKSWPLKKLTHWFEGYFYRKSIGNIGMSPPISDYIKSKAPEVPLETIYNISDCELFQPNYKGERKGKFTICYTGTFGLANDLTRIIHIAENIQSEPVQFIFIGAGADKPMIEEMVQERQLENVEIRSFSDKLEMARILEQSDAMFISFANYNSLFTGSPNKLFDGLAAGKLIITNFDGWIGDLITKENCGFHFEHNSSIDFMAKLRPFIVDQSHLVNYQKNARTLAEKRFDLKLQSQRFISFIEESVIRS
ncbi:glycosyltransferase family 4 protein [Reichenbachiella ulvae]|uniref:Glycosyltransferase family 4 protein n=1 Tax=Reichenbachiella ulvae TaxID=2980104 RepID=A0ABT3CY40_9BACT|nr:glycosyltransferase family 4 protein [Reichenbachiella ulvae]MCV9388537.1 glycosyltransferase family 4 protein [Reichenbachiella ulvae]